ncbi:MFS transporter [Oceanobacillus sp. CFH 90083]|uniref:MFS transporter n=1 Tax=Oceanobacillus sp. CFH 90083 TaxID=2592336 RepID=UPI00128B1682|nr:MFS transporter [Oceanobacillus sp. CFH 90083]
MSVQVQTESRNDKIFSRDFLYIWVANFFIFLGFQMTIPTIPLFVKDLGGSDQMVGVIVGIFTFSALLIRPYAGHALESKGRGFVYLIGLGIFVLSVGAFAFTASILFLIIIRIIQGVGWGFSTTAGGTIATDLIPPRKRGEGMGYFGLSGNIALSFGPSLGLTLVVLISYQQLFLLSALCGVLAFLFAMRIRYKKVDPAHQTRVARFDVLEKSALQPSILLFFITFAFGGISTFLPLHAIERGVEGIQLYFFIFAVFIMVSRLFSGRLYDRKGHKLIFLPAVSLVLISMILLAWLPNMTVLLTAAALFGLGFGAVQPALQAWAVNRAPADRKGMANATFFSSFDLGVGIGAILFGQIAAALNYTSIYLTAAVSIAISMLIYVFTILGKSSDNVKVG